MIVLLAEAFELDLPPKEKLLLIALADSADAYGVCFPSVATLSRKTSMPERSLQRSMGWLIEHGIVQEFWRFTDKNRHRKIRHFRLAFENVEKMPQPDYSNCPKELRQEVILRFEMMCSYCSGVGDEKNGPDGRAWHVDRIVPGRRGGSYVATNVTLSCATCNIGKGARLAPQGILDLGAKLDDQGCQIEGLVVPPTAPEPSTTRHIEPSYPALSKEPPTKHAIIRKSIQLIYESVVGLKCPWDASEAKHLTDLIKSNSTWTTEQILEMVKNRYASDGVNGERPRVWLSNLSKYACGPLDQYGKLKPNSRSGEKQKSASQLMRESLLD